MKNEIVDLETSRPKSKSKSLTPAQRVEAAFAHQKTDRIAIFHAGFSSYAASILLGRTAYVGGGINQWREAAALWEGPEVHAEYLQRATKDAYDLVKASHNDIVRFSYWRMLEKPTKRVDENTFFYGDPDGDYAVRRFDPGTELYQVIDRRNSKAPRTVDDLEREVREAEASLDAFHPSRKDFAGALEAQEYFGPDYPVQVGAYGLSVPNREPLWMESVAARPDLVARLLEYQCEVSLRLIEVLKDLPFRYNFGGGDFWSKHGPFYSPRFFRELLAPRLKRMSDLAHRYGKYTIFSSDGNLWPVADDLFGNTGTDAYHEIDRRAGMDLRELRRRFPHLTLMGNMSSATVHMGTRDQVIAECRDCAEAALELGSIIVGASNYVLPGTPPENLLALIQTTAEYH